MKKLLILLFSFFLLSSPSVFAEKISCSYIWENEANFISFERLTNKFLLKSGKGPQDLDILNESKDFLVLGRIGKYAEDIDAYFVLFFNKKTKKFRSQSIYNPLLDEDGYSTTGKCRVE